MIHKLNLFDWISSYDALKRLIIRDVTKNKSKVFHAVVYGKGNGKRYLVKGNHLITICKKVKKGITFNNYT